jgi:hypothetical protein
MQFDPSIHTKEFLLSNPKVAYELAEKSSEFAVSELAKDFNLLSMHNERGKTLAHELAAFQPEWFRLEAAKNQEVLSLAEVNGITVAHWLAYYHSEWIKCEAAHNLDVLSLTSGNGDTVASYLLIYNEQCVQYEHLMQKQILTLEYDEEILAETVARKWKSDCIDVPVMAMKLISQGAAYKHSKPIPIRSGEIILKQCKVLMEDNLEPVVSFKQLQALYSAFTHNVSKILSTQEQKSLHKWQSLLLQSENLIRQHLDNNPYLYDIEHTIDIFCEPGDDLLKKLQSERILASDLTSLNRLNNTNCSEQEPKIQSLY